MLTTRRVAAHPASHPATSHAGNTKPAAGWAMPSVKEGDVGGAAAAQRLAAKVEQMRRVFKQVAELLQVSRVLG